MSDDREVTIRIVAKNLSKEEFDSARKQLAGLGDETEKVRQKTKPATTETNAFATSWKQLTAAFTAANLITDAVYGLVNLGKEAFTSAGKLVDLRDKTGLSLDFLQRMGHVAKLSGSDVGQYSDAIYKLGLNVAKGGDETKAAVAKMGMSWADFKRMSPEDQFLAIADNINFTSNVQERNATVTDIAGKGISNVLVGLVSDYRRLAEGATVASDAQILALDAASDRWDKFKLTMSAGVTQGLGGALLTFDQVTSSGNAFISFLGKIATSTVPAAIATTALRTEVDHAIASHKAAVPVLAETAAQTRDWASELAKSEQKVKALTATRIAEIDTAKRAGATQAELTEQFSLSGAELKLLEDRIKSGEDAQKKATEERERATAAVKKNEEAFRKLAQQQAQTQEAERLIFLTKALADAHVEMAKRAEETAAAERKLAAERAAVTNKALTDALAAAAQYGEQYLALITTQHEQELRAVETQRQAALKAIEPLRTQVPAEYEATRRQIMAIYDRMLADLEVHGQKQMGQWSRIASGIPNALVGGIASGNPASSISSYLGGALFGDDGPLTQTFFRGLEKVGGGFPAGIYQGLANAIPGLGALAGPMIEKGLGFITGIVGKVFGSAGRDAVKDFAASMGGFDALHQKLNQLPNGVGEKLWIQLTQGVGKNNPEQAKAAIEAITRALEDQAGVIASEAELLAGTKLSWKEAEDLVKKYGIETTNSGKALEQAKLSEQSEQIAVEWRKMLLAGMDVKDVTTGMADEAQVFLDRALKMGLEVPESMRPMLEKMVEMGLLTDASGNKMEDLSGIEFSTDPISLLVKKMDELLTKMFGIGDTAEESERKTKKAFEFIAVEAAAVGTRIHNSLGGLKFEVPITFGDMPDLPEWSGGGGGWQGGGPELQGFSSGGMAHGPLNAYIEPGRKEIIGDVSFMEDALAGALARMGGGAASLGSSGGSPTTIIMPIYLGTEKIDERILKVGQSALQGQVWQVPQTAIAGRTRF